MLEQGAVGVDDFDPVESALLVVLNLIKNYQLLFSKLIKFVCANHRRVGWGGGPG
jgi:hypothetical protein